jgi:hypothetical protein
MGRRVLLYPQNVVNVSVDDVQVVKQKEKDKKRVPPKDKKEWAKNTIVHIAYKKSSYFAEGNICLEK